MQPGSAIMPVSRKILLIWTSIFRDSLKTCSPGLWSSSFASAYGWGEGEFRVKVLFLPLVAMFCLVCMTLLPLRHSPFWFVEVSLSAAPFAFIVLSALLSSIALLLCDIDSRSADAVGADDGDADFPDDASSLSTVSIAGDVLAELASLAHSPFVSASGSAIIADSTSTTLPPFVLASFSRVSLPVAVDMICLMLFVMLLCRC